MGCSSQGLCVLLQLEPRDSTLLQRYTTACCDPPLRVRNVPGLLLLLSFYQPGGDERLALDSIAGKAGDVIPGLSYVTPRPSAVQAPSRSARSPEVGSSPPTCRKPLGSFSLMTSRQYSIRPVVWRSLTVQ